MKHDEMKQEPVAWSDYEYDGVRNKPVAWMDADGNISDNNDYKCFPIPLFTYAQPKADTSPQPQKPLTDEQKYELIKQHLGLDKRRDDTVIDQVTGRFTDAARYFDLIDASIEAAHNIKE